MEGPAHTKAKVRRRTGTWRTGEVVWLEPGRATAVGEGAEEAQGPDCTGTCRLH